MAILELLWQCVAMAFASLLVGSLPLVFKSSMSARALNAISVLGMGILVGAALTIIIPEGVAMMYKVRPGGATHTIGLCLLAGFAVMLLVENFAPHPPHDAEEADAERAEVVHAHAEHRQPLLPKPDPENDPHCSTHAAAHGLSATLGMVIHAAADGIALGASSLSGSKELGLVVFIAVLVHKGPTALGLTTTLLTLHLSPAQVRRRLIVFSLAAPSGAIITYALVWLLGTSTHDVDGGDNLGWWTAVLLLFSGGSFLYVATVLQPISQTGPDDHCHDIHHEVHKRDDPLPLPHLMRAGLILSGMILPSLLTLVINNHDHD